MAKKAEAREVFAYQTGIKVSLIVIDALLAAIMILAFTDANTWYRGLPAISLLLVPIVAHFAWVVWQDSGQKVTVTNDKIIWENGAGRFYRQVSMSWGEIGQMQDDTRIFTIGRRFLLVSSTGSDRIIKIDSSLNRYKDLLRTIIRNIPPHVMDNRAQASLRHIRLLS